MEVRPGRLFPPRRRPKPETPQQREDRLEGYERAFHFGRDLYSGGALKGADVPQWYAARLGHYDGAGG
jgi:hypothetical protein